MAIRISRDGRRRKRCLTARVIKREELGQFDILEMDLVHDDFTSVKLEPNLFRVLPEQSTVHFRLKFNNLNIGMHILKFARDEMELG